MRVRGCIAAPLCYNRFACILYWGKRGNKSMVTKRQLGIFIVAIGSIELLGIVAVDLFGAGQWGGFGPLQRRGIGLGLAAIAVGSILVRLGDRPA